MTDTTSPSLFVRIDSTDADAMKGIPALAPILARYIAARTELADHAGAIAQARAEYESDDIEIDDCPAVSRAYDGTWVSAWLWVSDAEPSEDEAGGAAADPVKADMLADMKAAHAQLDELWDGLAQGPFYEALNGLQRTIARAEGRA